LHKVLQDNPPLRSRCLSLEIIFDDDAETTDEDYRVANDLISWLGQTRSLRLYGGFPAEGGYTGRRADTLKLISIANRSMTNLKELLLYMENDTTEGLSLAEAMAYINFPSLEILTMIGNGHSKNWPAPQMLNSKVRAKDPQEEPEHGMHD
jgi:hypothetical protein